MFNIKLDEKSYKMSFKALPVKLQRSNNRKRRGGGSQCAPPGQIGLITKNPAKPNMFDTFEKKKVEHL